VTRAQRAEAQRLRGLAREALATAVGRASGAYARALEPEPGTPESDAALTASLCCLDTASIFHARAAGYFEQALQAAGVEP